VTNDLLSFVLRHDINYDNNILKEIIFEKGFYIFMTENEDKLPNNNLQRS